MNKYIVENNNYFIFDKDTAKYMVYFLWGKFDFRLYFCEVKKDVSKKKNISFKGKDNKYFLADKLQHQFRGEWYDFQKVTSHGFTFEETEWVKEEKTHYAEFPKELFNVAAKICAEELDFVVC